MGSCPPHTRSVRTTHTLTVLSFFTLCAGYAATRISCYGSTVPYTESSIRLLSTSGSLLCLCSRILTSACVVSPWTFHSVILSQARCNFISHNGTFLNTPEGGEEELPRPTNTPAVAKKGEKKLLQPLLISRSFTLFLSGQKTALPRCCAKLLPVVLHCFGATHTLHLIYLFISSIFLCVCVYICVYFSCAFCYILFSVTARI